MRISRLLLVFLVMAVLFATAYAEQGPSSHLGETLPDFEVTTISGEVFRLSDTLKEKEAVFINLWATWCPPCRAEFPYLQEAWERYQDRVSVIALSVEPGDTDEKLISFAEENGLTFLIGSDTEIGLNEAMGVTGIPTSLLIDRFGRITWIDVGAQPDADSFCRLFEAFLGDDYTETILWDHLPPKQPSVPYADEAELNAILDGDDGKVVLHNPSQRGIWPMLPTESDGHSALISSNAGIDDSAAAVCATVTAESGDVLAFEFRTSTEAAMDLLSIVIDGTVAKSFGGEHSWSFWALPLTEGTHEIVFSYEKDGSYYEGDDAVWISGVRVLSGEEASQALALLPVFPSGDAFTFRVRNENAYSITFSGEAASLLTEYYGNTQNWILSDDTLIAEVVLRADMDPEAAFAFNQYDGTLMPIAYSLNPDCSAYIITSLINTATSTGLPHNLISAYPDRFAQNEDEIISILFFADETNADYFTKMIENSTGLSLSWTPTGGE